MFIHSKDNLGNIWPKANTNTKYRNQFLLILLATQPGQFVGDHNIQLCSTLHNLLSLLGWYVVGYLSTISPTTKSNHCQGTSEQFKATWQVNVNCYLPVVHHQEFQFIDIVHNKLLESIGQIVACFLVWAIANIGHQNTSFELSPDAWINTLRSSPVFLPPANTLIWQIIYRWSKRILC